MRCVSFGNGRDLVLVLVAPEELPAKVHREGLIEPELVDVRAGILVVVLLELLVSAVDARRGSP